MFDSVHEHLAADDDEERRQNLARPDPRGQHRETERQDGRAVEGHGSAARIAATLGPSAGYGKAADFDNVAHANDQQHDPQLEALDNVRTSQLEEVVLLEAFEDGALDLHKLVGDHQSQERVGVRVDSHVERDDLVVQRDGMNDVVDQGECEHPHGKQHF